MGPTPEYWHLDAKASHLHMKIRQNQMPVAPDFGRTAYSMQGFTLHAGKVDLNLSAHADPVTGYVAMSRFKKADDVLIIQACLLDHACDAGASAALALHLHLHLLLRLCFCCACPAPARICRCAFAALALRLRLHLLLLRCDPNLDPYPDPNHDPDPDAMIISSW